MKKYDFIIIGCGISCLYLLKLLKPLNLKIAILEKKSYPGGRIHSIKINNNIIDFGALRFNNNHKLLLSLLKEYNINDIEELTSKININISPNLMNRFKKFLKEASKKQYNTYAFSEITKNHFSKNEYELLKLWFGYEQKWEESNCQHLASNLLFNYHAKKYYHLKNGLSQLIDKLYNDLKDSYDFFFQEKVSKISEGNNIYTFNNNHYTSEHIIFACPPHYIKHIQGTNIMTPLLNAVGSQTLNRIYAYFDDGEWFPKNVIHSFYPICQIVPINENIIMISYSTERDARYWIEKEMDGKLWESLKDNLEKIGLKINSKPKWIKQNYWNPATHFYKPCYEFKETQENSFNPINKNWHIIGEAYSNYQGWIEGALMNSKEFFNKFVKNKFNKNKEYTLKEIKKHNKETDAWIAIYNNVYDITNWIKIHPGGEIIKYGIGKDATEMFKNVGHSSDALDFLNYYKIGILKV